MMFRMFIAPNLASAESMANEKAAEGYRLFSISPDGSGYRLVMEKADVPKAAPERAVEADTSKPKASAKK